MRKYFYCGMTKAPEGVKNKVLNDINCNYYSAGICAKNNKQCYMSNIIRPSYFCNDNDAKEPPISKPVPKEILDIFEKADKYNIRKCCDCTKYCPRALFIRKDLSEQFEYRAYSYKNSIQKDEIGGCLRGHENCVSSNLASTCRDFEDGKKSVELDFSPEELYYLIDNFNKFLVIVSRHIDKNSPEHKVFEWFVKRQYGTDDKDGMLVFNELDESIDEDYPDCKISEYDEFYPAGVLSELHPNFRRSFHWSKKAIMYNEIDCFAVIYDRYRLLPGIDNLFILLLYGASIGDLESIMRVDEELKRNDIEMYNQYVALKGSGPWHRHGLYHLLK